MRTKPFFPIHYGFGQNGSFPAAFFGVSRMERIPFPVSTYRGLGLSPMMFE
ncbi:hypothetical protein I656_03764 [Geobacillus sp. WSUCF1]|nr:hypothetical protein I656_03764 [Geobacillus sp. WSUCF1]